jgi:hypothetical protein
MSSASASYELPERPATLDTAHGLSKITTKELSDN